MRRQASCALVAIALSSCATVGRGRYEVLEVNSEPPGATVTVSTGETGTTPTTFSLRRKRDHSVVISRDGFEPVRVDVKSQPSRSGKGAMAGNAAGVLAGPIGAVGGVVGVVIDKVSGATKDLKPNPINVKLIPVPAEPSAEASPSDS